MLFDCWHDITSIICTLRLTKKDKPTIKKWNRKEIYDGFEVFQKNPDLHLWNKTFIGMNREQPSSVRAWSPMPFFQTVTCSEKTLGTLCLHQLVRFSHIVSGPRPPALSRQLSINDQLWYYAYWNLYCYIETLPWYRKKHGKRANM